MAATPCGRSLFYSRRTGRYRAGVHADFPRWRLEGGALFGPAVQRFAGIGQAVQFGRRRRRDLFGYCRPPEEKALTNCDSQAVLPSTVSTLVRWRAPQNSSAEPASATTNPLQKSCPSRARKKRWTGGCGTRLNMLNRRIWENGGGGWESNPPGTLLSPTLVLKTRSATRPPHTSTSVRCAACRGRARFISGGLPHTPILAERTGYFNRNKSRLARRATARLLYQAR